MNKAYEALEPNIKAVNEFWAGAVDEIEVHSDSALFGEQTQAGLIPPVFQFSDNREDATHMAQSVLSGKTTTLTTPLVDFTREGLALPAPGDMSIICDGDGMPVALVSDTDVKTEWDADNPTDKVVVETFEVIYR
ncbi:hypothetical protein [Actinomyces minihominis]|uniref:hypothetical protein n=1 Tax=Actinomyces minihominis TaxID=2002838 RepID=UPI000C08C3A6|nr:hypothetical protein [Actinomyces minihominis]